MEPGALAASLSGLLRGRLIPICRRVGVGVHEWRETDRQHRRHPNGHQERSVRPPVHAHAGRRVRRLEGRLPNGIGFEHVSTQSLTLALDAAPGMTPPSADRQTHRQPLDFAETALWSTVSVAA